MKVKGWVSTDRVGSKMTFMVNVDDEDLSEMDDNEKNALIDEVVFEQAGNHFSWGWKTL